MPGKIGTVDLDAIGDRELIEAEIAEIAKSAYHEVDDPAAAKKEAEEAAAKEAEAAKPKEKEAGAPAKEEETLEPTDEEKVKAEQERLLSAKDEELSDDDKAKKAEVVKAQETEKQKAFEDETAAYAKESNISLDEAKKDLEHIGKLQEKYKNDPKQLAKANLYLQRLYTKTENDLKAVQEKSAQQPPQELTSDNVLRMIDSGTLKINGKPANQEQIIAAYREKEADLTETLEDDAVLKLAVKAIRDAIGYQQRDSQSRMSSEAKDKRAKLLSDLSDADKKYLSDIKPVIDKLPDAHVMNEQFGLAEYLTWAKGNHYDEDLKVHGEKEYNRGLEQAKILGVKKPAQGAGAPKPKTELRLTEEEKKRALDMFDGVDISEEEKFKSFVEVRDYKKEK